MLWPAATWKGFRTRWGFIFRVVFLSSPCFVELNIVLGRLRHPLTTYVTVPGLALVTVPLFSLYQSFEQLLQPLVLLPSCVPACMLMIVIDRPTMYFDWAGVTGVATMQIKIAFLCSVSSACLNIWRCVATSFSWLYVLLLCYHAFAIVVVVKNKKRMKWNEWMKIATINSGSTP